MKKENYSLDTLIAHSADYNDTDTHSYTLPIFQTNAYHFESSEYAESLFELKQNGHIYSRISNPNANSLEDTMTKLEGGVGSLAMSSGHAAIFNTIINLANSGDEIVSSINIYGGAINLLGVTLGNLGIKTTFVDPDDMDSWENAITDKTKALFVELIGNPNANIADISAISKIAKKYGIPLIVDSTFSPPCISRPIDHGADIVIHSATKFLCGNGTAMGGIVVDSGNFKFEGNKRFPQYNEPDPSYHGIRFATDCGNAGFITRLRALILRDIGACLSPFNAYMISVGIQTLSLRVNKQCENAMMIASYLSKHPDVEFVNYPGLESDKYHDLATKYLSSGQYGSIFTFGLKGGRKVGAKFVDSLKLIGHVANVGDLRSLVIHPASTTHSQLSSEQLIQSGINEQTIRLSIGIESVDDLINDLDTAIRAAL